MVANSLWSPETRKRGYFNGRVSGRFGLFLPRWPLLRTRWAKRTRKTLVGLDRPTECDHDLAHCSILEWICSFWMAMFRRRNQRNLSQRKCLLGQTGTSGSLLLQERTINLLQGCFCTGWINPINLCNVGIIFKETIIYLWCGSMNHQAIASLPHFSLSKFIKP